MRTNGKAPGVGAPGASTFTLNSVQAWKQSKGESLIDSTALSPTGGELRKSKSRGLWRGHPATPTQNQIIFPASGKQKAIQADVLIELLRQARREGHMISQYFLRHDPERKQP